MLLPKLRFKGFDYEWHSKKLGDCLNVITNGTSTNQVAYATRYPVTRIETISDGYIDYNKVGYVEWFKNIDDFRLKKGDILFSNINSVKHIGKVAFFNDDCELYHGMNLLKISTNEELNPKFLYYLFNTDRLKKYFYIHCKQAVNQASLSIQDICNCDILIPTIEEQSKIADFFSLIDRKIQLQPTKDLLLYKKGLLNQMFI